MKLFLTTLVASLLLVHGSFFKNDTQVSSFTYESCGDSSDIAKNVNLYVSPELPQTDYTLYLDADLSENIFSGSSNYDITINGIPFQPSTNDLCTEIANSNITCPLENGHLASESKGTIPSGVSGKIVIKNQWYKTSQCKNMRCTQMVTDRILCMLFTIRI